MSDQTQTESNKPYIGRFAPSPTGPLHFGSLFAAVISYLHAKQHKGKWLLRIEDIDPLREQTGAAENILQSLETHGLIWDDEVTYQSRRSDLYEAQISKLKAAQVCVYCTCSRKQLSQNGGQHTNECRLYPYSPAGAALKFKASFTKYLWNDEFQQQCSAILDQDFVLKRKEGFYSYQLAVVTDDIDQQISHIVRGYDLLDSTPMQLALYHSLGKTSPTFAHFPVISHKGQKLSKQNLAPGIQSDTAQQNLLSVFQLLGIHDLQETNHVHDSLKQAIDLWDPRAILKKHELAFDFTE